MTLISATLSATARRASAVGRKSTGEMQVIFSDRSLTVCAAHAAMQREQQFLPRFCRSRPICVVPPDRGSEPIYSRRRGGRGPGGGHPGWLHLLPEMSGPATACFECAAPPRLADSCQPLTARRRAARTTCAGSTPQVSSAASCRSSALTLMSIFRVGLNARADTGALRLVCGSELSAVTWCGATVPPGTSSGSCRSASTSVAGVPVFVAVTCASSSFPGISRSPCCRVAA